MTSAGWVVVNDPDSPTGLIITAHNPGPSPIKTVKFSSNLPKFQQPQVLVSGGVNRDGPPGGGAWDLSFAATADTSTIEEDAVAEAVIDGVAIDANLTAGMTSSDVAAALYQSMVNAGIKDAVLSGSDITFLNDTAGLTATDVSLTFTGPPGGDSVNWLEIGITLPSQFSH
jgi:hypothetical protein